MPSASRPTRSPTRPLFVLAMGLAIPAYVLTNEAFRPIEHRATLEGSDFVWTFHLDAPESLFFECEYTVRADGDEQPRVHLEVNGVDVASLDANLRYVVQRRMVLVPVALVGSGENQLRVRVTGPSPAPPRSTASSPGAASPPRSSADQSTPSATSSPATITLTLRLHNYYGISPRFPRAVVVSDDAVADALRHRANWQRAFDFSAFYLFSLGSLWLIARQSPRRSGATRHVMLLAPSVLLWGALGYGLATPLHLWLSYGALAVLGLVPLLLVCGALWVVSHGTLVARMAGIAALTIATSELALRAFNLVRPSPAFYTNSYSRYRGQPGASHFDSRLNSRGFNDLDYPPAKPPGAYRIAALGDSAAFGVVPYGANYLTLLESALDASGSVEVINLGVAGTEPKDYLTMLLDEGLSFQPDLVMVNFFVGNDFEAAARKPYERSYVATSLYFLWTMWRAGGTTVTQYAAADATYVDDEPTLSHDRFLEIEVDRARIYRKEGPDLPDAMTRVVGYLREIRDISRRAGAEMVVVLLPAEIQLEGALQQQVARARGATVDQFDFNRPNRLLADALSREGIAHVDLLPAFERESRVTRLYKPMDTHWNLAGNRLAATTIAQFLRHLRQQ